MYRLLLGQRHDNDDERAHFVQAMTNLNPQGFRQPGRKPGSLSMVQKASIKAGWITEKDCLPGQSKRSKAKRKACEATLRNHARIAAIGIHPKYRNSTGQSVFASVHAVKEWKRAGTAWDKANPPPVK